MNYVPDLKAGKYPEKEFFYMVRPNYFQNCFCQVVNTRLQGWLEELVEGAWAQRR